jgi:hypothetical protein
VASAIYAIPEMVGADNGILLGDHLGMWNDDVADAGLWAHDDVDRLAREREFPGLVSEIEAALGALAGDRERVRAMAAASRARFDETFSPERHAERLGSVLEELVGA